MDFELDVLKEENEVAVRVVVLVRLYERGCFEQGRIRVVASSFEDGRSGEGRRGTEGLVRVVIMSCRPFGGGGGGSDGVGSGSGRSHV